MKVRFNFSNDSFSGEDADYLNTDAVTIDWKYPALPRAGDFIDTEFFEEVYKKKIEELDRFLWTVDCIDWVKDEEGNMLPIIWVTGN